MLSFADLKKYQFSYWFAFPAIHSIPQWTPIPYKSRSKEPGDITQSWQSLSSKESCALVDAVQTWRYATDARQHGFFLARRNQLSLGDESVDARNVEGQSQPRVASPAEDLKFSWRVSSLSSYDTGFFQGASDRDCFVCFADPSNYADAPGWMLRNLLILVRQRWRLNKVQVLRYRDVQSKRDQGRSMFTTLQSDTPNDGNTGSSQFDMDMPKVTGWERNASGKLSGRVVDLTAYMDPRRFAKLPPCCAFLEESD